MDSRLSKPLAIVAIIVALGLGLVLGMTSGIADRIFGGPNPKTIASASLESMRAQNRLIAFAARYVSVTTSTASRFGFSAKRTLILPGDVRYELDLSKLQPGDVKWDGSTSTLRVRLPEIEIAGPDVDLAGAQEYGEGGVLSALTNAGQQLDQANRARAVQNLRQQAQAEVPMRLARQAARQAVERSFGLPLMAAGFKDVKVVARFPTEGTDDPSYLDLSTPYEEAIKEAERRRAAQGQK
jgi:Protein of unknown function (DUF4230)